LTQSLYHRKPNQVKIPIIPIIPIIHDHHRFKKYFEYFPNRHEELFGWKIFQDIADHFVRNGIAVLLYDDRGMGGSGGNVFDGTTADFATDAPADLKYLQSRSDINPKQIGLCGHSEGGIVAPLAASRSDEVAFIICISGTGHTGEQIILAQSELIAKANHLFQKAATGSPSEYAKLPGEFVPGFLDSMTGWILRHVDAVK